MLVVNKRLAIPLREFEFAFARSGGPGGQNVNKVNTKVTLHWRVASSPSLPPEIRRRLMERYRRRIAKGGVLVLASQRFRNRGRNVADCLAKLRDMLEEVAEPPRPRKATRPPRAARERRLTEKHRQSQRKQRRRPPGLDQ